MIWSQIFFNLFLVCYLLLINPVLTPSFWYSTLMPPYCYIAYSSDLQLFPRASSFTPSSGFTPLLTSLHVSFGLWTWDSHGQRLQLTGTAYSGESGRKQWKVRPGIRIWHVPMILSSTGFDHNRLKVELRSTVLCQFKWFLGLREGSWRFPQFSPNTINTTTPTTECIGLILPPYEITVKNTGSFNL